MKLNFEELPQATAFLLEKVEELTISINEMKQLLKRQTAAKEEMELQHPRLSSGKAFSG